MPTTIKAALKKWEEATGRKAGEAKEIKLIGVYPPIEKMEVEVMFKILAGPIPWSNE